MMRILFIYIAGMISLMLVPIVAAEPVVIRFSHIVAENTPKGQMALRFKQLVEKRLNSNEVQVQVFPNATLFGDGQVIDEMLKGSVEMAAPSLAKLKKYSNRIQVFDLPFIFVTPDAAENFLRGPYGDRILRLVRPNGLIGLGYLANGMRQITANIPIQNPEDVDGLKIRYSGSTVTKSQYETLGAIPLKEKFSAVYGKLASGEIDAQENTWSNIYSKKFYEHQSYFVESNHSYLGYMILTSQKFWESLDDDLRNTLETALKEAIEFGNKVALAKVESDKQALKDAGVEIHLLTVEQRRQWTLALRPVWEKYEDEIGTDLINAAASSR